MDDAERDEIRQVVEEILDERERRAQPEPLGVARVPPREEEPARDAVVHEPGEHEGDEGHDAHAHMPHFPLFVRDENGTVVELDPREVPRYECQEPDCQDPTHDHGAHDHGAHDGGNDDHPVEYEDDPVEHEHGDEHDHGEPGHTDPHG